MKALASSRRALCLAGPLVVILAVAVLPPRGATAQQAPEPVQLGTADNFAVLAGQGITNTGPTTVNGDLGTWPNPSVTGAGLTVNGTIHAADAVARQAQADTTVAYNAAAGRTPVTTVATDLGNQNLEAGVYDSSTGTFEITGPLTLDAENNPDAVFIFKAASTLKTASASSVNVINGGSACNVFWQVGSSATLGTSSTFRGTILALASITITTGVTLDGRALARNGAVTMDSDTITRASCKTPETTGTTVSSSANTSTAGEAVTFTATVTSTGGTPTGSVTFLDNGTPVATDELDSSGLATYTTTTLGPGSHTDTAVYTGSPGFENSTSPPITQVVTAAPTTTTTRRATTTTTAGGGGGATTTTLRGSTTTVAGGTARGGGPNNPRPSLPTTGSEVAALLAAGLLAIVAGATMRVGSRRRT